MIKKIKQTKGLSLLELIVAVALFAVVIIASTEIFKMVIDGQRNAISSQNVQENVRYAMERISKEIRMAQISNTDCLAGATKKVFNVVTSGGNDRIYFKNKNGNCVSYYLSNNRLTVRVNSTVNYVTPAKLVASNLKFNVVDDSIGAFHSVQPYVTMTMDLIATGLAMHKQEMKVQFTVSSRYYE